MRPVPVKAAKRDVKPANKKPVPAKKKKMAELKSPIRDTISETISFVIKGKLTPIKPIMIDSKLDLVTKAKKKPQKCGKIVKNRSCKKPAGKQMIKKQEVNSKVKAKVQIKAAKKPSAQIIKKSADKILTEVLPATPKGKPKKVTKPTKKKPTIKTAKEKKPPVPKVKTQVSQIKKIIKKAPVKKEVKTKTKETLVKVEPDSPATENKTEDDIKKQQTIEKLLKQASKQLKSKTIKGKLKKASAKHGGDIKQTQKQPKGQQVKGTTEESKKNELNASPDYTSDEIPLKELSQRPKENPEQSPSHHKASREVVAETPPKPSPKQKIKPKPKMDLVKKRVIASKSRRKSKDEKRKSKLFSFWNGPKRHRVASLNALAKVHCLYENETRGNILDILDDDGPKSEYNSKRTIKKEPNIKVESDDDTEDKTSSEEAVTPPTRTLRCVPGLRAIGKHWDMHDTSSSSEDNSDESGCESVPVTIKKEKAPQQRQESDKEQEEATKEKRRRRNRNEVIMDLKDMVVRKRMASLNASAILAASYSVEKRPARAQRDADDSSSYASGSSEEYFAASDDDTKDDDVKEEDRKLIEVHTTPNKKVAVILNQDTDVTITGVYVNSTTRSTHHEGYCSIAGMQYRISATSHTQTAATAVATETLLQSASSSNAPDNSNSDSLPSSKSYTPLDALSNMQPPPGPGIQHNHPVLHSQQHMGPPQHVLPIPPHQLSPGLRHGCSSAFSSPHSTSSYPMPPGHHPPLQGEPGYVHGYYQPAGPLITVPHGHGQPPPPPLTKSAPLSEASPTSTTPSASHDPPPPPSSNGDSSDSEVIITSVTTGKDSVPPPSHHPNSYRFTQYPTAPPGYSYSYPPPYHYPTPPPPNPSYAHHDLCYPPSPYVHHKYPSYRRYLSSTPYYPTNPQELYPVPPTAPSQSQQVVTTTPGSASGPAFSVPPNGPPPPTLMETYPAPQPTLVETYQPPPHYFSPAYGPAPPCYTHSPSRAIPYINATYQSCPCPMQSCPKNVLTGPLTGDSKRSNISSISKDSMPLPPVALALPLEPASATGPPSPARGSAGMPPPPSPAGATYQPPPPPTKQESHSPEAPEDCKTEKKRKARVGKAMVRSNMQQNTMLLMCNPTTNYVSAVKREIESPKEKDVVEQKKEMCSSDEEIKIPVGETETPTLGAKNDSFVKEQIKEPVEPKAENVEESTTEEKENDDTPKEKCEEILQPIINTVAENVKVKNMKRKLSMTKEKVPDPELSPSPRKKQRLGSYKYLIKRDTNTVVKIHNGKRKLIDESVPLQKNEQIRKVRINLKKPTTKRKMNSAKEINNKRLKMSRPLTISNLHNNKQNSKAKDKILVEVVGEIREPLKKVAKKVLTVNSKNNSKSAPAVLDSLFARNNVDRIIESVVSEACLRTPKETSALKTVEKCGKAKEPAAQKKSTNKIGQVKVKSDCKATGASRRKSKCKEVDVPQAITKSPRRSLHLPRWSNGWRWEGEPYEAKVFLNSDETTVVRTCYPAMRHEEGDKIFPRDCVLLKAGPRKNDLPFVAKIASLWENPEDGEMMMSLLWYYRPEHTEQGRLPTDQQDEVFASRHKDSNSVACIDDKCYVLTFSEYCRYRKRFKRIEEGIEETLPCIPNPEPYPRSHRQPPTSQISPEMVFFCRRVYDFRQKRIMKNPT